MGRELKRFNRLAPAGRCADTPSRRQYYPEMWRNSSEFVNAPARRPDRARRQVWLTVEPAAPTVARHVDDGCRAGLERRGLGLVAGRVRGRARRLVVSTPDRPDNRPPGTASVGFFVLSGDRR